VNADRSRIFDTSADRRVGLVRLFLCGSPAGRAGTISRLQNPSRFVRPNNPNVDVAIGTVISAHATSK